MIPLLDDDAETLREIYDRLDGLLLPGGVDMDPAAYGESAGPGLGRIDPARDRVELQLTRWAIEDHKPILGLCRGLQVINVARGGTLYQDIQAELPGAIKHDYFPTQGFQRDFLAHDIAVARGLDCSPRWSAPDEGEQHAPPGAQDGRGRVDSVGHRARWPDRGGRGSVRSLSDWRAVASRGVRGRLIPVPATSSAPSSLPQVGDVEAQFHGEIQQGRISLLA